MKDMTKKETEGVDVPSAACLECAPFLAFMKCFGLTPGQMKR